MSAPALAPRVSSLASIRRSYALSFTKGQSPFCRSASAGALFVVVVWGNLLRCERIVRFGPVNLDRHLVGTGSSPLISFTDASTSNSRT